MPTVTVVNRDNETFETRQGRTLLTGAREAVDRSVPMAAGKPKAGSASIRVQSTRCSGPGCCMAGGLSQTPSTA